MKNRGLATLVFALALELGAFGQVTYQNPVIPGDYPDPSIIRVGDDYFATATTSEWAPLFPILHSRDLVNWRNLGPVFQQRPDWAVGNFWAPEIAHFGDTCFIYYVGRKRGGPLSIAVATAKRPEGPWTDHGPFISQEDGSIDPVPVEDGNGRRYLIWKEDGNSRRQPTPLWIQELTPDGTNVRGDKKEILRNNPASWEGGVVEGPFVIRHGGYFYLFYAGNACCGRGCHYGVGVARAKNLLGPWEKNPANPLIRDNEIWKCPGHGSLVQDKKGDFYFIYHAYHARDFVYVGRQAVLDKVEFENGWPVVNGGRGTAFEAPSPLGAKATHAQYEFADEFSSGTLNPEWQWPQNNEPRWEISSGRGGSLRLHPNPNRANDPLGGILALKTASGFYTAETVLDRASLAEGTVAGLCGFGDMENAVGLAVNGKQWQLWRRSRNKQETLLTGDLPESERVHLRLVCRDGHKLTFSLSRDGTNWKEVAPEAPLEGNYLPPWDRGVRIALNAGGNAGAAATFESFRAKFEPPPLRP